MKRALFFLLIPLSLFGGSSLAEEPTSIGGGCAGTTWCPICGPLTNEPCDHYEREHGGQGTSTTRQLTPEERAAIREQKRLAREEAARQLAQRRQRSAAAYGNWKSDMKYATERGAEASKTRIEFRSVMERALVDDPGGTPPVKIIERGLLAPAPVDAAGQLACAAVHAKEAVAIVGAASVVADAGLPTDPLTFSQASIAASATRQVFDTGLARPGCADGRVPKMQATDPEEKALFRAVEALVEAKFRETSQRKEVEAEKAKVADLEKEIAAYREERAKRLAPPAAPVVTAAPGVTPSPVPPVTATPAPVPAEEDDPFLRDLQAKLKTQKEKVAGVELGLTNLQVAQKRQQKQIDAMVGAEPGESKP